MKRIKFLLSLLSLMLMFSACDNEPYIMNVYYIENASENDLYLSYKYENSDQTSPFIKLEQHDSEKVFSYFPDSKELSSIKLIFTLKYEDKYYTISEENVNGPTWYNNYRRDIYLDHREYPSKSQYNCEAYVFSITDEFIATLTPNEE